MYAQVRLLVKRQAAVNDFIKIEQFSIAEKEMHSKSHCEIRHRIGKTELNASKSEKHLVTMAQCETLRGTDWIFMRNNPCYMMASSFGV